MVDVRRIYLPVDTEDGISLMKISPSSLPESNSYDEKLVNEFTSEVPTRHFYLWPAIQIIILFLTVANLTILIFKSLPASPSSSTTALTHKTNTTTVLHSPCGNSSTTALASGCRFDIISFSWLPPACDDKELSNEFQALREWVWYEDEDGTVPVTQDEALTGRYPHLYVSFEYHLTHCTYLVSQIDIVTCSKTLESGSGTNTDVSGLHSGGKCIARSRRKEGVALTVMLELILTRIIAGIC